MSSPLLKPKPEIVAQTDEIIAECIDMFNQIPKGTFSGNDFGDLGQSIDFIKIEYAQLILVYPGRLGGESACKIAFDKDENTMVVYGLLIDPYNYENRIQSKPYNPFTTMSLDPRLMIARSIIEKISQSITSSYE